MGNEKQTGELVLNGSDAQGKSLLGAVHFAHQFVRMTGCLKNGFDPDCIPFDGYP